MKRLLALMIALVPVAPVFADPMIQLPERIEAKPGRLLVLEAVTTGKMLRWVSLSDGADVVPYLEHKALFVAPTEGEYRVLVYTALGDVPSPPAICVVVVGKPRPPGPPKPVPTPPQPSDDPLIRTLRPLYDADRNPAKAEQIIALIALYREAVRFAEIAELRTTAELAARLKTAAGVLLPPDALPTLRRAIGDEIGKGLGTDAEKPLTPEVRRQAAELFGRIATVLEEIHE